MDRTVLVQKHRLTTRAAARIALLTFGLLCLGGTWAAFRVWARGQSEATAGRRAGLDRRISELNFDGDFVESGIEKLRGASGARIGLTAHLRISDRFGPFQVPLHAHLRDVKLSTALSLLTDEPCTDPTGLAYFARADGVIQLCDRSAVQRVMKMYDVHDLLPSLAAPAWSGPPLATGADNLLSILSRLLDTNTPSTSSRWIWDGRLVVCSTADEQARIAAALEVLRHPSRNDPSTSALLDKLDQSVGPFRVEDVTVAEALDRLGDEAHVNLVVDWLRFSVDYTGAVNAYKRIAVTLSPMPLRAAIGQLFDATGAKPYLVYAADDNVLIVSQDKPLPARFQTVAAYDVRDLVATYSMEEIAQLMQGQIDSQTWRDNGGSVGQLFPCKEGLIAITTADIQQKASRLLSQLRHGHYPVP